MRRWSWPDRGPYDGGYGGTNHYDIYSLAGGTPIVSDFIQEYGGTGIAFDGSKFFVSHLANVLDIFDVNGVPVGTLDLGSNIGGIEDLSFEYSSVPEPASLALMGTGLLVLGRRAWQKRPRRQD